MRHVKLMTLAVTAAGLLLCAPGYAENEDTDRGKWSEKMEAKRDGFFKELGLNEEQKKALKANKEKHRQEKKALFEDMHAKMKLIREELQKENLDMGKVNQIQAELKATQAKMLDQRLAHILEVRKILTPEQFKKFSEKMEKSRDSFGHGDKKMHKKDKEEK
jgi:Spy/CpxP family protein refolding chaperone